MNNTEVRLINANKLLEDIEDAIDIENDGEDVEKSKFIIFGLKLASKYIEKAQTIKVQPVKHGRWMYPFYCSECGFTPYYSSDLTYNFCPNCGVRMDGDSE